MPREINELPVIGAPDVADSIPIWDDSAGEAKKLLISDFPGGVAYTADESSLHLAAGVFSILTTWTGQAAITTLGTIDTGTWHGTPISAIYLQQAAADLGDVNVTVNLSNSHVARTTSLVLNGAITASNIGTAASNATSDFDAAGTASSTVAALSSVYQPLDSDLTAIAALATDAFGRAVLTKTDAASMRTYFGLGTAALSATGDFDAAGTASSAVAALSSVYQPLDADLTAIAALATDAFGRALLIKTDAAGIRTYIGLGSAALSASTAFDAAGAAAAAQSASQPLDSDLTAIAALTTDSFGRALLTKTDAAGIRSYIGLGTAALSATGDFDAAGAASSAVAALSSVYQPLDADLTAIAALATDAFGRALLIKTDAASIRTYLGLGTAATSASTAFDAVGAATAAQSASQPLDSDLTAIAALTTDSFGRALLTKTDAATICTYIAAATLASPTFTGTPAAPTATTDTNTTQLATTAFAANAVAVGVLRTPTMSVTLPSDHSLIVLRRYAIAAALVTKINTNSILKVQL